MLSLLSALRYGLIIAAGLYLALLAALFFFQRSLLYVPTPERTAPAQAGLANAQELELATADGEKLIAWYVPAKPGQPTLLYLHGNGGALVNRAQRFALFANEGWGVFAMSYRGYSGSTGSPSEANNVADALIAYDKVAELAKGNSKIIVMGESLGTGVAVQVAGQRPASGLVLDAPYSSMAAVAQSHYPMFPVSRFILDRYDSEVHILKVKAPILIMHGTLDAVIPVRFGEALAAAAPEPKTLVVFPNGHHEDLVETGGIAAIKTWLAARPSFSGAGPPILKF